MLGRVTLDEIAARVVAALGEAGARELLDALTPPDADRAALIGRLHQRADTEWLAEVLIDLEEDRRGRTWWRRCGGQSAFPYHPQANDPRRR